MGDILPVIFNGNFLEEDLQGLRSDPVTGNDVDLLNAFMDQVAESPEVLWKLAKWKEQHWSPYLNCSAIDCFQMQGYNVYRLRPLSKRLSKYRILYAYNAPMHEFHFLAVVVKRLEPSPIGSDPDYFYNYEPNHPISVRIRTEYDDSGFKNTRH